MSRRFSRAQEDDLSLNIWPAFVDGFASLLIVALFVLTFFVLSHFFLNSALNQSHQSLDGLKTQLDSLSAMLSVEQEEKEKISTSLLTSRQMAQRKETELSDQLSRVQEEVSQTQQSLSIEQQTASKAQAQVDALTGQLESFNEQVSKLSKALNIPESSAEVAPEEKVKNIATTLDEALVRKVEELAKYRSNFFGKLQIVLGDRPEIKVVGDRFVLRSEVLFPSASALLSAEGRQQLTQLGALLKEVMSSIPDDINWVLRVDGHTDARPIHSGTYPSNWELSFARAMAVVRFLVTQEIPPQRLAAAGFGQFQPLVEGKGAEALSENRRIELKLDQR